MNAVTVPSVAIGTRAEVGGETAGARVAAIEEPGAARGALVCDQVRVAVVEDEIVDVRDTLGGGLRRGVSVVLMSRRR